MPRRWIPLPLVLTLAAAPLGAQGPEELAAPAGAAPAPAALLHGGEFLSICIPEPGTRAGLRDVQAQVHSATGDTFVVVRRDLLPLAMVAPRARSYAAGEWLARGEPVRVGGRDYGPTGERAMATASEMEPAGIFREVRLFRRRTGRPAGEIYVPVGPGCEFAVYRAGDAPVRNGRTTWYRPLRSMELLYATNRVPTGKPEPARYYGNENRGMEWGRLRVSIPPGHRLGHIELPRRPLGVGVERTDSLSHMILRSLQTGDVAAGERRPVLVFIHGYNTTFQEAAWRAAQLAHDLDFEGVPYFFSWPSQGRLLGYGADVTMVERSRRHFAAFLDSLVKVYGADNLNVVVHSMGHRGFVQAVEDMRRAGRSGKLFNVVVMASPDRDYEVFAEQDLPVVLEAAGRVAVYASRHDVALSFSGFIHGRRRAGGPELLAAVDSTALEVIDTSHRSGDFTGHSDYAQSPAVLADIFLLLRGRSPGQRNLVEHPSDRGRHWDFRP